VRNQHNFAANPRKNIHPPRPLFQSDGYEFYRYVPRDHPPAQVFDQNGVNVDVSIHFPTTKLPNGRKMFFSLQQLHNSTDTQVVLDNVNLASSGRYRCEVSAEAPSFQTVSDHGDMVVVGELINRKKEFRSDLHSVLQITV
jgi:hypothetical protein